MSRFLLSAILLLTCVASNARSDIVIDIEDATVVEGTPGAVLDVIISSDSADEPITITADFEIVNADFLDPPGVFDQSGFYNEGNYNGASTFERDTNDASLAFLSLDIDTTAAIPGTGILLAQLFVDSAALTPGDYNIQVSNVVAIDGGGIVATTAFGGTLEVTVIPEPTGAVLLGAIAMLATVNRRRRD